MPSQNSLLKISGRMGNHIFYYRKDIKNRRKYFVRRAPETVKQTSATKRAAADFGTASKSSSLLRNALREYTSLCYDHKLHYHLNAKMGEIVRADINHPSGQKLIRADNMLSLQGFRFNSAANIQSNPVIKQNDKGDITISFPNGVNNKSDATYTSFRAIGLSLNLTRNSAQKVESNTVIIKPGDKHPPELMMNINRRNITLIILEIQSFYEVNGQLYSAQNKQGNALDIIAVLTPVAAAKEKKYRNKAPHFWLPYATPPKRSLVIIPVSAMHPPPDPSLP